MITSDEAKEYFSAQISVADKSEPLEMFFSLKSNGASQTFRVNYDHVSPIVLPDSFVFVKMDGRVPVFKEVL